MSVVHQRRLIILLAWLILLSVVIVLVLFALRQNINLFFTPSEIAQGQVPTGKLIKMGGMVVAGSIKTMNTGAITFVVTDYQKQVQVHYQGVLPNLFRDKQGVVVRGVLKRAAYFEAYEVLAKHDANYMPKEVADALHQSAKNT